MPELAKIWQFCVQKTPPVFSFLADVVTVIVGAVAIWGLIFHKKELSFLFRLLLNIHLNERIKRVKESLGKLESLNYDEKEDRAEIFALLGQICGQIKGLMNQRAQLSPIHTEVSEILITRKLTEAVKRKILYELHGALDDASFAENKKILESKP